MLIRVCIEDDVFTAKVESQPDVQATGATPLEALEALVRLLRRLEDAEDAQDLALAREVLATDHARIPHAEVKRILKLDTLR